MNRGKCGVIGQSGGEEREVKETDRYSLTAKENPKRTL
jgi:hypothetical protein